MEKLTCTPDNIVEFNQALRTHLPESRPLLKALITRGMLDGLRGATIAPVGALPDGVQPVLPLEAEKRIQAAALKTSQFIFSTGLTSPIPTDQTDRRFWVIPK